MGVVDISLKGELTLTIIIEMNWFLLIELPTILAPYGSGTLIQDMVTMRIMEQQLFDSFPLHKYFVLRR